jgi:hypothetical protein
MVSTVRSVSFKYEELKWWWAAVMNYTEMEAKVREATNNEPYVPNTSALRLVWY